MENVSQAPPDGEAFSATPTPIQALGDEAGRCDGIAESYEPSEAPWGSPSFRPWEPDAGKAAYWRGKAARCRAALVSKRARRNLLAETAKDRARDPNDPIARTMARAVRRVAWLRTVERSRPWRPTQRRPPRRVSRLAAATIASTGDGDPEPAQALARRLAGGAR